MGNNPGKNLINVITSDHRAIEAAFNELENKSMTPETRGALVDHVIAELVRHSVAEEQFMYPAVRKYVSGGDEIADHEIEEHAEAERVMKDLDEMDVTDPRFEAKLHELMSDINHHVHEEESTLLPNLAAACSIDELQSLGEKVVAAKMVAPTRPHPSAPDTPPANLIVDPGAGLVDRLRDAISGRNT
ncbi:MAG: hemerythrin domain-containing protein [Stackebrandtia sp.]